MHSIRDALGEGVRALVRTSGGFTAAALEAEILLGNALGKSRAELYAHSNENAARGALRRYRAFIARRKKREPIAYIVESKEFFGLNIAVARGACLIPRPETETLVLLAIEAIKSKKFDLALEVGAGSGAIAVALAKNSSLPIYATEISTRALALAKKNAARYGVAGRVKLFRADLLPRELPKKTVALLIVANLPYLRTASLKKLPPEIKKYEPRRALDGGRDGLALYRRLFERVKDDLADRKTLLLLEIDPRQIRGIEKAAKKYWPGAKPVFHEDLSGNVRVAEIEI